MASKGPRSKLDHETRAKRQKALEAPKEPQRPKTHWDHVLEEMVWLSKDFESERKWKLAQARKVALRASKGMLDQATRGEKRVKEEEHRLRKVALNISKDVKKFWLKIEKLVLYKHQLELDEKKKKALDKQLEFLLGQTERYSTMLAENLVSSPAHGKLMNVSTLQESKKIDDEEGGNANGSDGPHIESKPNENDMDEDYDMDSGDESEDDERTIEEDEALITKEEREEELAALKDEIDLPLEVLLMRYSEKVSRETSAEHMTDVTGATRSSEDGTKNENATSIANGGESSPESPGRGCDGSNGFLHGSDNHFSDSEVHNVRSSKKFQELDNNCFLEDFSDEQEDEDFNLAAGEEKDNDIDDETTILEEEELAKAESNDSNIEIALLQNDSEIPIEELLARYKKDWDSDEDEYEETESENASAYENLVHSPGRKEFELKQLTVSLNREDNFSALEPVTCSQADEAETECTAEGGEEGESANRIADAAAAARSAQPTGNTFSTTKVRTKFPFLLKYPLREYQHIGLDWLVTMYEKKLNGILADEMGLGKTIMTIALLAHLACEKGIWGPHLIVVPTSVMLNWETEFLKWCPAFKILTYFGSAKERRIKRQGWLKPNSFHVCITTYRLVIQDSKVFKRKKWKYLILDEAHLIKNWKSQRWQTLLNFNSKRRILLTGTPLQNDLMELWSLMHFLMPHIFQSHQEFKDWFSNPITGMVEGQEKVNKEVVDRLHNVLRPFILRRLKRDVEKQLPMKHEHVIYCRLSKRQRNLYEDFIASSETQATLSSANFFGMISVIMQLRKVCNHPDLFEGRPIVSSFDMSGIDMQLSSSICTMLVPGPFCLVDLHGLGLLFTHLDLSMSSWESEEVQAIATPSSLIEARMVEEFGHAFKHKKKLHGTNIFEEIQRALESERQREAKKRAASIAWWNSIRCRRKPIYPTGLRELVTIKHPVYDIHSQKCHPLCPSYSPMLADIVLSPAERFQRTVDQVESFMFAIPAARAPTPVCWSSKCGGSVFIEPSFRETCTRVLSPLLTPFRPAIVRRQVYFPDRRLIQFDCGKLQELAVLLRRLKLGGHRALIFTQMTKMLDVLEAFINLYGYTYMRLDGSTQPEERQTLMQRFNTNPKIFLFILSTRSGGVGINLVGADTVIFYDSDWNPAMDQQAQDRCHRIGQTREVHIYRLISESTIEENILKKANQKRVLDDLVIQSGGYNTEFFKKLDPMELFSGHQTVSLRDEPKDENCNGSSEAPLSNADVEAALKYAEDEADYMALKKVEQEEAVENQEFTEEAIGRLEEDEFVNDEDVKADEKADEVGDPSGLVTLANKENVATLTVQDPVEAGPLTFAGKEDDFDMLADVKEMAAAAAASGQTILSFENQLRPIDRYAIRFMELWDPIIDKTATLSNLQFEEKEWELDRIEKLKEDMEADIDDDEEPFVYESWDTDIATEVYRQQVEALTKHQLEEEQELEARERELAENANSNSARNQTSTVRKLKSKKKTKKAKFKSLKKGALADSFKSTEESPLELMPFEGEIIYDDEMTTSDNASPCLKLEKKRKQTPCGDEERSTKKSKKLKKDAETPSWVLDSKSPGNEPKYFRQFEGIVDTDLKLANRSKVGKKISIIPMPVKRVVTIKAEKPKKKGNTWSKEFFPLPDFWLPQEDAVLCAAVNEYGSNWSLVSEILYGNSAGGRFRGRYRHPVHCCERFRELVQKNVLSSADAVNSDKACNTASGKALLRVTEDHIRILLDATSQLSDSEHLVQKHFFALLSSTWRFSSRSNHRHSIAASDRAFYSSSKNHFDRNFNRESTESVKFSNLSLCGSVVSAALCDEQRARKDDTVSIPNQIDEVFVPSERLDISLELLENEHDRSGPLPSVVNVSILGHDSPPSSKIIGKQNQLRSSQKLAETRFRDASTSCLEDCLNWASQAFPSGDAKSRTSSKSQTLGKHKLLVSDSNKASRSKLRKTAMESNDPHNLPSERVVHPVFNDFSANRHLASSSFPEFGIDDVDFSSTFNELSFATEGSDLVPHEYVPDFISGLDDCSIMPDFTDVG